MALPAELGGRTRTEAPMRPRISGLTAVALLAATASTAGPDRVTFPTGYRSHALYSTVDRAVNDTVRVFYVSPEAARRAKPGEPLPNGTVITMEIYKAKLGGDGKPVKDGSGRFVKGELVSIQVMEKRTGWGAAYDAELRNGDWDYAQFDPDGTPHQPADAAPCLGCHRKMASQDFVFSRLQLPGPK
jgi:hypothetical protein